MAIYRKAHAETILPTKIRRGTYSTVMPVRPWKTPSGRVVKELPDRYLLRERDEPRREGTLAMHE